ATLDRPSSWAITKWSSPPLRASRMAALRTIRVRTISIMPSLQASSSLSTLTTRSSAGGVGAGARLPPLAPSFACAGLLPFGAVLGAFAAFAAVAALSAALGLAPFVPAFFVVFFVVVGVFFVVAMVMAPLGKG